MSSAKEQPNLIDFQNACAEAYVEFKKKMFSLGWYIDTQDSSDVNLTMHDKGKFKGKFSLTWKEFWSR